jgi:phage terminase large subunit-like protein
MKSLERLSPRRTLIRKAAAAAKAELERRDHEERARDWAKIARPEQRLPLGDEWRYWLIQAGRGCGKTRVGGETVRGWSQHFDRVNLIGATWDDARDIMVDGESGILAICSRRDRPTFLAHKKLLRWQNGSRSYIFTADEPERLRGKQHRKLWCDELGAWRYAEDAWDQAMLGLRLKPSPQAVITTTPRPIRIIRELRKDPSTVLTTGTVYDNRANLAAVFYDKIIKRYEGTRLGRQELNGELLEDNPNALWTLTQIDKTRIAPKDLPALKRIVVALDPSVTSNVDSDECGLLIAALGVDDRGYVLEDLSDVMSPDTWAKRAVHQYQLRGADRVVAEVNNGGDLVEMALRTVDRNVSYRSVHASRGKLIRAEPVSALYEQGRISHVGAFPKLEDELTTYDAKAGVKSPNRLDVLVWAMYELFDLEEPTTTGIIDFYAQQEKAAQAQRTGHAKR